MLANDLIFIFSTTLMYATPLIFVALGGVICEKSGVINIGLEGLMTFGAFMASLIAIKTQNPFIGLIGGGFFAMVLSFFHGLFSLNFKANQVVSGMAINFLGGGLSIFLCRLFFEGTSMTPPLDLELKIPTFLGQYLTVYIAIFLTIISTLFFYKTHWGLRLISGGENPKALESSGVNQLKYKFFGVLMSGFLSGLGGASLSIAIVSNFRPTLISGQGFIALSAVIFGKWTPHGAFIACLFFGLTQSLVVYLGGMESPILSSQILSMIPYIFTLLVLIFFMGKTSAPSALSEIE